MKTHDYGNGAFEQLTHVLYAIVALRHCHLLQMKKTTRTIIEQFICVNEMRFEGNKNKVVTKLRRKRVFVVFIPFSLNCIKETEFITFKVSYR